MRVLVFLLVLVNLLFFALVQGWFGREENPDGKRLETQVKADQLKVVSLDKPPAGPLSSDGGTFGHLGEPSEEKTSVKAVPTANDSDKAATKTTSAAAKPVEKAAEKNSEKSAEKGGEKNLCQRWNDLPAADAERLQALLTAKYASLQVNRSQAAASGPYWVLIPPLPAKADADRKAGELNSMGVTDYFVVNDGPNRFAISLGVFSTEKAARERLEALKGQGVRSAKVAPRNPPPVALEVRGAAALMQEAQQAADSLLPKARRANCAG